MEKLNERLFRAETDIDDIKKRIGKIEKYIGPFNIECFYCGYRWFTQSRMEKVNCPSCGQKVPTTKKGIRELEKQDQRIVEKYIKDVEKENKKYPTVFK